MQTLCSAPAKLILSGEHAALYNCPALSLAIKLHSHCEATFIAQPKHTISIELSDYQQHKNLSFENWHNLTIDIESRYQLFEKQVTAIQSVLSKPIDLILVILHHFDIFHSLEKGQWHFKIYSNIPIGRGLGSSAAIIMSVLGSLFKHHKINNAQQDILKLAQQIECRQHGKSSGIDTSTVLLGGLIEFRNGQVQKQKNHNLEAWLIDTGKPGSSTGQAVSSVKKHFANNQTIWQEFERVTQQVIQAWSDQNRMQLLNAIAQNQNLLETIGVVPNKVKLLIQLLKKHYNATAKVCGSGSVKGDNAGIVLCFSEQKPTQLCEKFGYSIQKVSIDTEGTICQQT